MTSSMTIEGLLEAEQGQWEGDGPTHVTYTIRAEGRRYTIHILKVSGNGYMATAYDGHGDVVEPPEETNSYFAARHAAEAAILHAAYVMPTWRAEGATAGAV